MSEYINIAIILKYYVLYKSSLCPEIIETMYALECKNPNHKHEIDNKLYKQHEDKILNLYESWGFPYTCIEDISAKDDFIYCKSAEEICVYVENNTIIFADYNDKLYWYSKFGHLHNSQLFPYDTIYTEEKDKIIITNDPSMKVILNYMEASYIVDIGDISYNITCEKCASRGRNIKSARN